MHPAGTQGLKGSTCLLPDPGIRLEEVSSEQIGLDRQAPPVQAPAQGGLQVQGGQELGPGRRSIRIRGGAAPAAGKENECQETGGGLHGKRIARAPSRR